MQCYHIFSNSRVAHLDKKHNETYYPRVVPTGRIWGSSSRTTVYVGHLLYAKGNFHLSLHLTVQCVATTSYTPMGKTVR